MGGIFGFFLGVSMVSVVHSVQKFYDRVMTRLGINMLLILRWKIFKEPSRMSQGDIENTKTFRHPISRLFQTLKSMGKKRELDSLKPKVSLNQT